MKKVFYAGVVVLLVAVIFWFYTGLNGNPIRKNQAQKDMKSYLEKTYADKDFKLGKVYYSMSFGAYTAKVTSASDESISFDLSWRSRGKITYDEYIYKYAKDQELSRKFADEIKEQIKPILNGKIPNLVDVSAEIYIKREAYSRDESYNKNMVEKPTIWIYMKGEKIPKEDFIESCVKARDIISKEGYKAQVYSFHYNTSFAGDVKGDGEALYSISFGEELMNASKEEILKSNKLWVNEGKGKMIVGAMIYKGVISLFILGVIGAGIAIAVKEKSKKIKQA